MKYIILRAMLLVCAPLWPLAAVQGVRVRRTTPRLPGAAGPTNGIVPGGGSPIRVLVIGESTAAGVGADNHDQALAGHFASAIARNSGRTVCWRARGLIGATAAVARERLVADNAEPVDVVVIVLGINDVLCRTKPSRWVRDVQALLDAVRKEIGDAPVLLAGVPPVGRMPALPQPLRFLLGLRAEALDQGLVRVTRQLPSVTHVPLRLPNGEDYFCRDRFHPSPHGYQEWGELLAGHLR
jgi:lysophospholipase L1-like esterase